MKSALEETQKYREYFQILFSAVKSLLKPSAIILDVFKSQLVKIPQIKSRYVAESPKAVGIWLFIEEDNWEIEERIYEAYGELLDLFPENEVDLRLLKLYGRKPEELLPDGFMKW